MTKALDRVKAAEAKYTGMVEACRKLEATLKELKSTAKSCQWSIDELRRWLIGSGKTRTRISGCLC